MAWSPGSLYCRLRCSQLSLNCPLGASASLTKGAESHPIGQRKLDEATANTLLGVLASIFLAVLCVVLGNITVPNAPDAGDVAWPLVTRSATALLVAGGTYLVLDLVLVVNLVHDAYEDAATDGAPPRRRWNDSDTA